MLNIPSNLLQEKNPIKYKMYTIVRHQCEVGRFTHIIHTFWRFAKTVILHQVGLQNSQIKHIKFNRVIDTVIRSRKMASLESLSGSNECNESEPLFLELITILMTLLAYTFLTKKINTTHYIHNNQLQNPFIKEYILFCIHMI